MTVPNEVPLVDYVGNGTTKEFNVPFQYETPSTLFIFVDGVNPPTSDYSFNPNTGNFVFYAAPADGVKIRIIRDTPEERDTDYDDNYNTFRPRTLNKDFDRLWRTIQEHLITINLNKDGLAQEILDRIQADENMLDYIMNQDNTIKQDYIQRDSVINTASIERDNRIEQESKDRDSGLKNYIDNLVALITGDPSFNGITTDFVLEGTSTQKQINDSSYRGNQNKVKPEILLNDGYQTGNIVLLDDGTEVISTIPNNANDPNVNMMGWVSKNSAQYILDESGLTQQQINNVVTKFVVSNSELLAIENPSEGWVYRVLETGSMYQFDSSQIAVNNGGTILNGWVAVGLKYVTPEMFGADPTGTTSSRVAIKRMLDSLSDGGVIECKPNAIYYNDAPEGTTDTWVVDKDKTYIIANGSTFKRRPTALATASIDHDLASLKVTGKNVTIEGKVYLDGSESLASIVNSSDTVVASGDYARGYASSHGLHLYGADYFTALQVDSSNAVFNIFADGCVGLNIKGRCKSSGQVYPVTGVDLNLGSGIKLSYCTDYDIDLYTEYAGYCGVEVEPACRFGRVNSVARWASHHGVSFHGDCEGSTVSSVAENCQLGAALRLGAGSRQINGTFSAKDSYLGLWVEPSSTDSTIEGDVTLCNIIGTSMNCSGGGLVTANNASGGKLRESTIKVRSRNDGGGTTQAFTLENAYECSFDLGVKTAKSALAVNKVHDSEIHMAYMEGITDASPMFFTADNTVDLTCKIGTSMYRLHRTDGVVEASSLITSASAIPMSNYFAFDIHASNLVLPTIATSSAGTVTNALWMDTSAANVIKRKTT